MRLDDESAATAVEYAMFVALVAAAIIATVAVLGLRVADLLRPLEGAF